MSAPPTGSMLEVLRAVAPGRPLREGLDRILQASMGAMVVLGDHPSVLEICSGGFLVDTAFSPQRLYEVAKMDGAIVVSPDASRIARANVHLLPDPETQTSETGTRHRTAERVARSLQVPVLAVSEEQQVVSVYVTDQRHQLSSAASLVSQCNQALQALERYRKRLDDLATNLSALEVEGLAKVRDVATFIQQGELVQRIALEVETALIELGVEGRLVRMQLDELMAGVVDEQRLVVRDYVWGGDPGRSDAVMNTLAAMPEDHMQNLSEVVTALELGPTATDLVDAVQARGYRLLSRVPGLGQAAAEHVLEQFGSLDQLLQREAPELEAVDGFGSEEARELRVALDRLSEASILDRYG